MRVTAKQLDRTKAFVTDDLMVDIRCVEYPPVDIDVITLSGNGCVGLSPREAR